MLIAAK